MTNENHSIDNISIEKPWSRNPEEILRELDVDPQIGLKEEEAQNRLDKFGPNRLREHKTRSPWAILFDQFKNIIIGLLASAAIAAFALEQTTEGIAILVAIGITTGIGFGMEMQAVKSMAALMKLGENKVKVRRDSEIIEIDAEKIVPGDIVIIEAGDIITADMRIIEASRLQANESALTGESLPVNKSMRKLPNDVELTDRENVLYKGTSITKGSGKAIVLSTGMETELGQISLLVETAEGEQTPLEKRLFKLGHKLVWVTLGISAIIAISGIISGMELFLIIETAIALAVATVPEGLPIVATIALARGMWRMANRNALMKHLAAVETLGSTNIICTDKTGTLTENRLTVREVRLPERKYSFGEKEFTPESEKTCPSPGEDKLLKRAIQASAFCNNASYNPDGDSTGDPLEIALLAAAQCMGFSRSEMIDEMPEEREEAFDPDRKRMAVFNKINGEYVVSVKGAPEVIIEICDKIDLEKNAHEFTDKEKQNWLDANEEMAEEGLRILGIAGKRTDDINDDPYANLNFYGLIGMLDPPRENVRESVDACQAAGIRVIMITGDHPSTARKIGLATGQVDDPKVRVMKGNELAQPDEISDKHKREILETPIFARVNPGHKLDLISYYQHDGAIVCMTGDGVNDAPALKKADIGIAMGKRGTQVAREAADMVLLDDAFSTIVAAIRQGRAIFGNIRKFVVYLMTIHVSEILAVGIPSIISSLPLPILPLQILYLNIITDVFPALALGVGEGEREVMDNPPRDSDEPILTGKHWLSIAGFGALMAIPVMAALIIALNSMGIQQDRAVTISFLTLGFAQLLFVFNMRRPGSNILFNEITRNRWIWGAIILCFSLILAAVYVPFLAKILHLVDPGKNGWLLVGGLNLGFMIISQIIRQFKLGSE